MSFNLKLAKVYKILLESYGKQNWWPINGKYLPKNSLNQKEIFEICLGAILTQNTSWNNVEKTLKNLREKNLLDIDELRKINLKKLAELIKSSGYNNQKARKIKEFIKFLDSGNEITRENLLSVWGIGKETADSILLYAYNRPYFVIDSYTKRIFSRLGFCDENLDYDKLQELFHKDLDNNSKLFNEYHALIVQHAKSHCKKKPDCLSCPLRDDCKYFKETR